MPARVVMFQGTSSHAGKSVLTSAFCRLLKNKGFRVAPFKAVNMSNNAWVTCEGGEIAVAQAAQARACGVEPTVLMNPVLLKTASDSTCQVILLGKPIGVFRAADLAGLRDRLMEAIEASLQKLIHAYECVVIEGAGSPAEVNLKETDFANMAIATMCQAPVILVADIERGGVFAQIVGTLELLESKERDLIQGFIINKFRGDPGLLRSGVAWLEERTGRPVLGVIPFFPKLAIPEEDGLAQCLKTGQATDVTQPADASGGAPIRIEVIRYPTISNFTDFEPFHQEPDVQVRYLTGPAADDSFPDLVILPGSKSTMADLTWMRRVGLDRYVQQCAQRGREIVGICGGFQMLGKVIYDPSHVESQESVMPGLSLLPTTTLFLSTKVTAQVSGVHLMSQEPVRGYEIHMGRVQGLRRGQPIFRLTDRGGTPVDELDGCHSNQNEVWGTYLHGIFDNEGFRRRLLARLRPGRADTGVAQTDPYETLANSVREHLVLPKIRERISWISSL